MEIAAVTGIEQKRLKVVNEYHIAGTLPETGLDGLGQLACDVCCMPMALISILSDTHELFVSTAGITVYDLPLNKAPGRYVVNCNTDAFTITDLAADERFFDHPFVTGSQPVAFYAGVPLVAPDGYKLGVLSVLDTKPGSLNSRQVHSLHVLAKQVVKALELQKKTIEAEQSKAELKRAYADLDKYSHIASHDLKSPFNNIISITHLLRDNYSTLLDAEGNEFLSYLIDCSYQLSGLVNGILAYSKAAQLPLGQKEYVDVAALIETIKRTVVIPDNCTILYDNINVGIYGSPAVLKLIITNLFQYAIRHNNKEHLTIILSVKENKHAWIFEVKDNGAGIAKKDQEGIFDLFDTLHNIKTDSPGIIGMCIAKRLVEKSGGEIWLHATSAEGTTIAFSIPR